MVRSVRKVLRASALGVGIAFVGTACLGTLPDPVRCPPATVYSYCAPLTAISPSPAAPGPSPSPGPTPSPGLPQPGPIASSPPAPGAATHCNLDAICIQQEGRACACTTATECKRDSTTCSPAPDCPRSIGAVASGATCIETTASILSGGVVPGCTCGCASCAATCDGQGPILGPEQSLRFAIPSSGIPATGRIGVMARIRGAGPATVVLQVDGEDRALGVVPADVDFHEIIPSGPDASYSWSNEEHPPTSIELRTGPAAVIEVDCVVPFLTR